MTSENEPEVISKRPSRGIEGEIVIKYEEYEYIVRYDYFYDPDASDKLYPIKNVGEEVIMNNPKSKEEERKKLPKIVREKAKEELRDL